MKKTPKELWKERLAEITESNRRFDAEFDEAERKRAMKPVKGD